MLKTLLLIGIGAAGTYIAYQTWPTKMPMPCPCNTAAGSSPTATVQPAVYYNSDSQQAGQLGVSYAGRYV